MATTSDAEIVLRLYELRREEELRKARTFVMSFQPGDEQEFMEVARRSASDQNRYLRQASTYWELCASLVLRQAVDSDLYLDTGGEGIALYAKFSRYHDAIAAVNGPFMVNTAKMIEQFPRAKIIYGKMLERFGGAA
jgi:hypothetical protein